ncbi:tRNA wybutosine-synthesizing protein 3 homolog isoform X5 [Cygnus olor]|uniref:tRNA wybutosine-synthesizing protein 3 homolog isoform X5 n=1 Tax=Cygnus olor TaxID=8869 RepID=UPI001ADDF2F1|nr:tRNA wybutosine-synthesizing protein 3 homolog isoform X5 [Cygnus olor]
MAAFGRWKAQRLARADASRKGALDERAAPVVRLLNGRARFCTTSSCAGRLVLAQGGAAMTALEKATGDVVFKFEPFVLHVLCRELQDAQLLAVRSTHCLEVPLSHMGKLMVSEEYIEFLIHVANRKMEENTRRIDRFYKCLRLALEADSANNLPSEETEKYHSVYVHRRKRKTIQEQDVHTSPKDHSEELEPEDDPDSNLGIFAETMM